MEKGKCCPGRAERVQEWSGSWRAPWRTQGLSGAGRSNLGGQSRKAVCTVIKDVSCRELACVWVLILSLPPTSSVTLDTQFSPSDS